MLGWMTYLIKSVRLSGSGAEKAVLYTKAQLETLGSCISSGSDGAQMGERRKETAYIQDNKTKITVPICAGRIH
jgi:hypothetical protein